jgi:ATP-dependent helicase/nuclease subunit A
VPRDVPAVTPSGAAAAEDPVVARALRILGHRYPYLEETRKPAVVAVTELKRDEAPEPDESGPFDPVADRPLPRFLREGDARDGRRRGVTVHRFLEHVDLRCSDLRGEFARLVTRGVFAPEDEAQIDFEALAWFRDSELGREIRDRYGALRREVPFRARLDHTSVPVLVRGVIDGVLAGDDGLSIFDFKTDRIAAGEVEDRTDHYRSQLLAYSWALQTVWRRPVTAARFVFLTPRAIVSVAEACRPPAELAPELVRLVESR